MAIEIDDAELLELIQELANLRGISMEDVVDMAVANEFERFKREIG